MATPGPDLGAAAARLISRLDCPETRSRPGRLPASLITSRGWCPSHADAALCKRGSNAISYQIEPNEGVGDTLRRIAIELIDEAIARTKAPGADRHEVVHEVRKACKKLRGLMQLARPAAPKLYATENARIRDAKHDVGADADADADAGVDATVEAFHEWRKRAKYLRYHLRLLRPSWPHGLERTRDEVKTLGDLLGEDHDLAVLARTLAPGIEAEAERVELLRALVLRRSELLRRQAHRLGLRIYSEKPKALRQRLRGYWAAMRKQQQGISECASA